MAAEHRREIADFNVEFLHGALSSIRSDRYLAIEERCQEG
jgi:hypothetical protein